MRTSLTDGANEQQVKVSLRTQLLTNSRLAQSASCLSRAHLFALQLT